MHRQLTNQDLTILEKELIAILANIPTMLGGGNHGHAEIIVKQARYLLMTGEIFTNPANPGIYPENVSGNAAAGVRARAETENKEFVREYKTFQSVVQATKDIILKAVNHKYLLKIEDKILGFLNQMPTDMLTHLRNQGGTLDFADTKTLLAERDREWDTSKVPQMYFNRVEKAIQGLTRAGITSNLNEGQDMALYFLKASGEFDSAVREWDQRPAGKKTWQNIKSFISTEYAKEYKQNKLTAKKIKANMIKEQAKASEELIAALTKNHMRQMETRIKSTTNTMKEMMSLIKNEQKAPKNQSNDENKKKQEERCKKYNDAPICKHCQKKHLAKAEDKCWEQEKNKNSRPSNWKSAKSTQRCAGPMLESETWQPGKVILNKVNTTHTYLATTNYWAPLHKAEEDDHTKDSNITKAVQSIANTKSNK
jgi:hypothetical protein